VLSYILNIHNHFYKSNLFITMSLDFKKESVLSEKLKYLYKMGLQQKKCIVNNIDVEFETIKNTAGVRIIERVNIDMDFEYEGALDGYEPHIFTSDLSRLFETVRGVITQYTPTQEGKIKSGDDDVYVSDVMIFKINYEFENVHTFSLSLNITYPD
jgi:hypothetical protein